NTNASMTGTVGGTGGTGGTGGAADTGRAVFTITDKAADMGAVTSVNVTVDSVSVKNSAGAWVAVPAMAKTYDLLQLKANGSQAILADDRLAPGNYSEVMLHISGVEVTDASGTHEAKLPSSELRIMESFQVGANSTSALTFDFMADRSLHVTGNGKYIMAPVVHAQAREGAQVDVRSESDVRIGGGQTTADTTVGMDENGTVGAGLGIPANATISIGADGGIMIGRGEGNGRLVIGIGEALAAGANGVTKLEVTVDNVSVQGQDGQWISVSTAPRAYDLMQIQGREELAADAQVPAGNYSNVMLHVSKVTVIDANGYYEAQLPAQDIAVPATIRVSGNGASSIALDFLANESLAYSGGQYTFTPAINAEAREGATLQVGSDGGLEISGGMVGSNVHVGLGGNGNTGGDGHGNANGGNGNGNGLVAINGSESGGLGLGYG
ncbi:MAG TPA: DUF4382 domain-containing protein, partial [Candidatus Micrarchaeota archaeon]|nr:DUF4382 domain-containing protein [Candidatus Micrarchaeota archaeon]